MMKTMFIFWCIQLGLLIINVIYFCIIIIIISSSSSSRSGRFLIIYLFIYY